MSIFLKTTVSICEYCYSHIPANLIEEENSIWITKTCNCNNQTMKYLVESDATFYRALKKTPLELYNFNIILFEVTDRCNLTCPHCYHLPNNKAKDKPIEDIFKEVDQFPKAMSYMLAGAEPTVRKDIVDVVDVMSKRYSPIISMLTNGVLFHKEKFVKDLKNAGLGYVAIGLNHESYQGKEVHDKQIQGILNIAKHGIQSAYIGYTVENWDHLSSIIYEAQSLAPYTQMIRIRMGSDIGRSPGEGHKTLSQLIKIVAFLSNKMGLPFKFLEADNNIYHVMVQVGDAKIRLIQWPDIKNIVMDELKSGPWCRFYDGPITNFVHQVITRDIYVNKGIKAPDICPEVYHYNAAIIA
jgi:hypothetical protein